MKKDDEELRINEHLLNLRKVITEYIKQLNKLQDEYRRLTGVTYKPFV